MHCQTAQDTYFAASYLENYLDCVENLPDDLQRQISDLRELDVAYQEILGELESLQENLTRDLDSGTRKRVVLHVQRHLIKSQEIGDEKLQIVQQILDLIENKSRQLELDYKSMIVKIGGTKDQENAEPSGGKPEAQPERTSKRARRQRADTVAVSAVAVSDALPERTQETSVAAAVSVAASSEKSSGAGASSSSTATSAKTTATKKKKKRRSNKVDKDRDYSPVEPPVDPDEPTYCLCQQISYGEMIGCDNERCPIEWFHFSCVGLTTKPKGRWFCPKCRGDRPNVQKPTRS